jgi:hypothetical protein
MNTPEVKAAKALYMRQFNKARRDAGLCARCGKPSDQFNCETCKPRIRFSVQDWRDSNKAHTREYNRLRRLEWKAAGLCQICGQSPSRLGVTTCEDCAIDIGNRQLVKRSKWTPKERLDAYIKQDGKCAICYVDHVRLVGDHCHATGRKRGLLCDACNTSIGRMKDDPASLRRAAEYIEGYQ